MENAINVGKAVDALADLMGLDRTTVAELAASGAVFDWHRFKCWIKVRPSCWVEVFDADKGDCLISMAIPESEARINVREPTGRDGWRRFRTVPAPLGFYHKNNRVVHYLKAS